MQAAVAGMRCVQHRHDARYAGRATAAYRLEVAQGLAVLIEKHGGRGARGGFLAAVERADITRARVVVHEECTAADAGALRLHEPQHGLHGHRGINGGTALAQDLKPRVHRQRICGNHPGLAAVRVAMRGRRHGQRRRGGRLARCRDGGRRRFGLRSRRRRRGRVPGCALGLRSSGRQAAHAPRREEQECAEKLATADHTERNPVSPCPASARSSATSTEVTLDAEEPIHNHLMNACTGSSSPHASISTRPSGRLRAWPMS